MSNENENERIDLTQFEDVKGPWEYNTDDDGWTLATIHERDNPDRDEFIVLMRKPNGDPLLTMNPNLSAITMVPELIAELKRMYEREDALVSAIKELCDSEDSTGCSGDLTVVSLDPMLELYELTSE